MIIVEEDTHETLESPMKSQNAGHDSQLSMRSSVNSRTEQMNEMMNHIDEMKKLIKDEEWYNIPVPIRITCEGIMEF